ncbi:hypothetical protein [Niallia sp. 03190]|uniref:hypothetical protein n=1 Tax=Niallia sp. 03190 TaxID=3458061 RepID=UPI004044A733
MNSDIVVAIIGGVITIGVGYLGYYGAIKGAKLQIATQLNKQDEKEIEERENTKRFIETFLYDEIENNLHLLLKGEIEAYQDKMNGEYKVTYNVNPRNFSDYTFKEVKQQLIKLNDIEYLKYVMSVYKSFNIINNRFVINEMNKEDAELVYKSLTYWINKLDIKRLQ